MSNYRPTIHAV